MTSIIELFEREGNVIVEASKYTEDQLFSILKKDFSLKTKNVQLLLYRSFNLEKLHDINSEIEETYFIKYSGELIEYDLPQIQELFTFSKSELSKVDEYGCGLSYTVIFGKEILAHIVKNMYDDEFIDIIEQKLKDFNLTSLSDDELCYLRDILMDRNIRIKNISLETISSLLSELHN